MTGLRIFHAIKERVDGLQFNSIKVECFHCHNYGRIHAPFGKRGVPPELAAKKFRQRGWEIGHNENHDLCPECISKRGKGKKPMLKIVNDDAPKVEDVFKTGRIAKGSVSHHAAEVIERATEPPEKPKAEPPREMQRGDRQVIFMKLADVYLDEARGYSSGWGDARVATDLNVPRAWVQKVRDENFGPVAADEDSVEWIAKATAMLDEAKAIRAQANDARKAAETEMGKAIRDFDKLATKHLERLRALGDIDARLMSVADLAAKLQAKIGGV